MSGAGAAGLHGQRGLAGAVRRGPEVELRESVDIELLCGLDWVDGGERDEDRQTHQQVVRQHVQKLAQLLEPHGADFIYKTLYF